MPSRNDLISEGADRLWRVIRETATDHDVHRESRKCRSTPSEIRSLLDGYQVSVDIVVRSALDERNKPVEFFSPGSAVRRGSFFGGSRRRFRSENTGRAVQRGKPALGRAPGTRAPPGGQPRRARPAPLAASQCRTAIVAVLSRV